MESGGKGSFEPWLKQLLDSHGVDGEVFGEYISGTLGTMEDSTADEISENLQDILSGCVEDEVACTAVTATITEKWMAEAVRRKMEATKQKESQEQHMETAGQRSVSSQAKDVSSSMPVTGELGGLSEAEKQRLVAQYDCESDGNSDIDEENVPNESRGKGGGASMQGLFQNMNASQVEEAVHQKKREQKVAHEAKVERDKKSREAQKQKAQDRKEKEKKRTQKQERRR